MATILELNSDNFSKTLEENEKPVLVDFFATWCGPCRMLAPILDAIAEEEQDRLVVGRLDIDANPSIAQAYRVMSVPTLILFRNNEVAAVAVGAAPKEEIMKKFEQFL